MKIDTRAMIPISSVNQRFAKVADTIDKYGQAVIVKNNVPLYIVTRIDDVEAEKIEEEEK